MAECIKDAAHEPTAWRNAFAYMYEASSQGLYVLAGGCFCCEPALAFLDDGVQLVFGDSEYHVGHIQFKAQPL